MNIYLLEDVQTSLRFVITICAFFGVYLGSYDYIHQRKHGFGSDSFVYNVPMFVLVCLAIIAKSPTVFVPAFGAHLTRIQGLGFEVATSIFFTGYLYVAMVVRLRAFRLSKWETYKRATAIFAAMFLMGMIGFYDK
jgi:hypothetical protein